MLRLSMQMDLYMQHWPGFAVNAWCNDAYLAGLGECAEAGLCDAVGVSNFNAERTRAAAKALGARGLCLASNQVQYSLLYREPERNGVLDACREAGTTLVAYSPLAQGLLTGTYGGGAPAPSGPRAAVFTRARIGGIGPLVELMREIGTGRGVRIRYSLLACVRNAPTHDTPLTHGCPRRRCAGQDAGAGGYQLVHVQGRAADPGREERAPGDRGCGRARLAADARGGARAGRSVGPRGHRRVWRAV
jgi:aryl-alcohol dehydrogenase-like predicted oxidoreductase